MHRTVRGFSLFIVLGILLVIAVFMICWWTYDPYERRSFGLHPDYVAQILSAYTPIIGATLIGFRNVLFGEVDIQSTPDPDTKESPTIHGASILYFFAGLGIAASIFGILFVSSNPTPEQAKWTVGITALLWAATTGEIFSRFFRSLM